VRSVAHPGSGAVMVLRCQTGEVFGSVPANRGVRSLVNRPCPHVPHGFLRPVTTDRDPISGWFIHHLTSATAWILQRERSEPGHDPQY
jgi:hypothetical protein